MKSSKYLGFSTLSIIFAVVVSGCSSSDDDDSSDITDASSETSMLAPGSPIPTPTSSVLEGSWTTGCVLEDENFPEDGYTIFNLTIEGDTLDAVEFGFTDSACSIPTIDSATIEISFSLEFPDGSVTTSLGEASFIDLTPESVTIDGEQLTPAQQAALEELGLFDTVFDIFLIDSEGRLYFGDTDVEGQNATTAEMRPQTLDTFGAFIRL